MLIGVDGKTLSANGDGRAHERLPVLRLFGGDPGSYLASLAGVNLPVDMRARDPLTNHVWVFVAAIVIATAASQAPYVIFREGETEGRPLPGKARIPKRGRNRRAVQRHIAKPLWKRVMMRGLDEQLDHPLMDPLLKPNPFQSGT